MNVRRLRLSLFAIAALGVQLHALPATDAKLKIHAGSRDDVSAIGHRKIVEGTDWYSPATEVALGGKYAREFEQTRQLIQDPLLNDYITRLGDTLAQNSDATLPFTVRIVESEEINCYAFPGFLYVTRGLILASDSEAQLTGVMAQGVAHLAARHLTRMLTLMNIGSIIAIPVDGGAMGGGASSYAPGPDIGVPMSFLRFSREFAKEGDYFAIQYMYKAGYEPAAFITFLEKLERREIQHANVALAFATHPPAIERIQSVKKEIATIIPPRANSIVDTPEFEAVKLHLKEIPPASLDERPQPSRPAIH